MDVVGLLGEEVLLICGIGGFGGFWRVLEGLAVGIVCTWLGFGARSWMEWL